MAEDMNLLQEVMKPSRVTTTVALNKELNATAGDQHRRRRHHVSHRAEPLLITPPQTTNNKQMSSSRSHLHHHHHQQTIRAKTVSSNNTEGRSSSSSSVKQRGIRERVKGGGGMQAFFLDSGKRSSSGGTGVFLPQTNISSKSTNKIKPACAPVLLPSRVVQALKLNVHSLGVQISPKQDTKDRAKSLGDCKIGKNNIRNNGGKKLETKTTTNECGRVVSPTKSSPDIFLPKEWTY